MYEPTSALTIDQAQMALDDGLRAIAGGQTQIDLSKVTAIDSSAVAVLLNWARAASKASTQLHLVGTPANLISLIDVYGVSGLLAIDAAAVAAPDVHHAHDAPNSLGRHHR